MAPARARSALPALLALLHALLPGPGVAGTSVSPPEAILPRGGSVQVNCSASCEHPSMLGMETQLDKNEVNNGPNWKVFELSNVNEDSQPLCFSMCGTNQSSVSTSITVYWFPERVELAPLPPWQPVGDNLTLRCLVAGGAPRARLSVVLLRGEEELSRQPALGEPAEVTATVLAGRGDHGANFSCRAELDLRPHGMELFQNTSAPRQLRTFVLPETHPKLVTPDIVEVGTSRPVDCSLDGLFPATEAQVHLALGDQRLKSTVTYGEDSLVATAWVEGTEEQNGSQPLVCAVLLGNRSRESRRTVFVYRFPDPELTLWPPEVSEGEQVVVECEASPGAVVTLSSAPAHVSGAPAGPPTIYPELNATAIATAEDDGRLFSCGAMLEVVGQVMHKNRTRELRVLYGPRMDETDCPGNWTWQEGSQQTLRCQARGNPAPRLTCLREADGAPLPIGDLQSVQREIDGTYVCRAESSRGTVTRKVVVKVLYHGNEMIIIILVTAGFILSVVAGTAYLYYRQRKIKIYKLQKAQEEAAMKLSPQATPP